MSVRLDQACINKLSINVIETPNVDYDFYVNGTAAVSNNLSVSGAINSGTWNGSTISIAYGGTGISTTDPHKILIGPSSGSTAAAPTWRTISAADLPIATTSTLGIVKAGNGINIDNNGTISVSIQDDLSIAYVEKNNGTAYGLAIIDNLANDSTVSLKFTKTMGDYQGKLGDIVAKGAINIISNKFITNLGFSQNSFSSNNRTPNSFTDTFWLPETEEDKISDDTYEILTTKTTTSIGSENNPIFFNSYGQPQACGNITATSMKKLEAISAAGTIGFYSDGDSTVGITITAKDNTVFYPIRLNSATGDRAQIEVYKQTNFKQNIVMQSSDTNPSIKEINFYRSSGTNETTTSSKTWGAGVFGSISYEAPYSETLNNVTTLHTINRFVFKQYSHSNSVANNYCDMFYLPSTNDNTEDCVYNILTSKSAVTIQQGGTGATTIAGARANLSTWSLVSDTYNTLMSSDGTTNGWVKIGTANSSYGLLPSQSGDSGHGHNSLGNFDWYWAAAHVDSIYTSTITNASQQAINISSGSILYLNSSSGASIEFQQNGVSEITIDANGILRPDTNEGSSLGTNTYKWDEAHITTVYGSLSGNASTATILQNARLLWGNSFDGSANVNETISLGDEARVDARINRKKEESNGWAFSPIRILDNADSDFAHFGVYGHANSLDYIYIGANNYSGNNLRITSDGEVRIPVTTTASSKTTGALTVGGGAGFGGTVYANEFNGPLNGEAATVRRATFGDASNGEHNADNITSNGLYYYTSNGPSTTGNQFNTSEGALYCQAYNTNWVGQIAQDYRNGALAIRGKKNGTWQNWLSIPTMITETYPALLPSNGTNNWIKIGTANTSYGILPSQTGGVGSGHNYLGSSTWYWSQSFVDSMYTNELIFKGSSCKISYTGTKNTYAMIQFIDNTSDTYGNGIAIGGGGQTIIGGGESTSVLIGQTGTSGAEIMWIGNDGDIELFPGQGNGFNNAYKTTINSSGITVGVEGNTTKETVFKVSSGAGSIGLYSSSSTTGNRGLWAYPHGTATSGKNIITLDTNNNINYASGTAGALYIANGSGVVNSSGAPSFYFLRGDNLAVSNRMGSIFCNYGTTNSITRCDKIYLRHYSYNSSTGAAINDWDQYCLPAATPDLTTSHTYNILTTKDMSFSITGNAATATLATKATGDSDGNTINTTYAKLSGAAFTGNITITKAGEAYVYSKNSSTGNTVYLDSGGGSSHGIWSSGYYNGSSYTSSGKWLIYRNDVGNVIVNGDCTGNAETATKDSAGNVISSTYLKLSGGTMSGHIYLGGSNASSSTANTTQIVFGTSSNQHLAISSNSKTLVLNPTTSSTTSQIVLALEQASTIPYGINTSQQSTMNRTNIGKFIDFCQNGSTCGCLRLQTLGTTTAEGYADLLLGNTTKSNANKNATGRVYLANSNGGWLEIKAMYGSLAGATRNYINIDNWLNASGVTGAVWNDYAEFRKTNKEAKAGQAVIDNDDGSLSITNKRLMPGAQIVSDTFGFSIGETEEAKTPLAVSGRVLVYTYRPREEYHAGMAVCSAPNGTIDIMTREEIQQYPDAIIGIVSEIPEYEEWGTGKVKVNKRIWIKIK